MSRLSEAAQRYSDIHESEKAAREQLDRAEADLAPARDEVIAAFVEEFGPGPFDGGAGGNPTPPPPQQTGRAGVNPGSRPAPAGTRGDTRR